MQKKYTKYVSGLVGLATLATLALALPVFAATSVSATAGGSLGGGSWAGHVGAGAGMHGGMMKPGVFGTVASVSGNIITVTSTHGMRPNTTGSTITTAPVTTTYTVDASAATITKNNVAGSISSIVVGDTIMAQGTLTGTNLVATTVRDGVMARTPRTQGTGNTNGQPQMTSPITGNGQPVIAGTISAISGNTLTVTNKSNVTYTVDVSTAKIVEGQNTITVANVATGDSVLVQGTVNGNSISASSVIDQKAPSTTTTGTSAQPKGFFGSIGAFFSHLFGF